MGRFFHLIICSCFILFYPLIICSPAISQDHGEDEHLKAESKHNNVQTDAEQNHLKTEPEQEHKHVDVEHANTDKSNTDPAQANLFESVILEERLGTKIPLDLSFVDENGKPVKLSGFVDRPVLLQLVFYHCPQSCNMMMANLASILKSVTFTPGKDYRIVTLSFDHEDTPAIASDTKSNYMNMMPDTFPKDEWKYLTGNLPEINALTSATGFKFKRVEQHNFVHPNVLVVLAHDGTIIRYLYGTEYLPFDVSMAITEAAKGTPAISIKKLLTFCFNYDPKGKKYVFKTLQVSGVMLLLVLSGFFFFVLRKGNKHNGKTPSD
ncbi:MAG: SCO family protein [Desulfamplus sp.]|nr:SCO family protein [Desulfamplus sp.]